MTQTIDQAQAAYDQLEQHAKEIALLVSIDALLGWDERTMLPAAGGAYRAEQMSYLAGLIHDRWTDPRMEQWLDELAGSPLAADPHSDAGATIHDLRHSHARRTRLPKALVEELARAAVLGQQVWVEAREKNDFARFRPALEKIVALKQEEADAIGYAERRYDALLDEYEPRETTRNVERILGGLRDELVPLVRRIVEEGHPVAHARLEAEYPIDVQAAFGRRVSGEIGFDYERGRLDVTAHPFCSQIGLGDCRLTTRYNPRNFTEGFFGILHEAGHGIYQQGLREEKFGLPLGETISLGIHESQSRLWENLVGRSHAFWEHYFPQAQKLFPAALGGESLDRFFAAANQVRPSLIRIESDEVTYNLHILIRFELEEELLDGRLPVAELPAAWNERYRDYLGIVPPNDAVGVLQDIHWSGGAIGYFPTYSLGNLYAAQFFEQANQDIGPLADQFRRGEFNPLRQWLIDRIHSQGRRYSAEQLVERVTGRPLSHESLMRHLRTKFLPLYGLD